MTLKCFIAHRGKPLVIFRDDGCNSVATPKEIGSFRNQNNECLSGFASQQIIKFMFIPTYSPNFGGIWETGVKFAKNHLKRVMGNSHLTLEEMSTLFAEVEAVLNSRPLCPLSSSPYDFLSLSTGHFTIERPLIALPSPPLESYNANRLLKYEYL